MKLCTSCGLKRRSRPPAAQLACTGLRRLRIQAFTRQTRVAVQPRPAVLGLPRQNTPGRHRVGSSRVASATSARSAPPISRSVITSATATGRSGQGRPDSAVRAEAMGQALSHGNGHIASSKWLAMRLEDRRGKSGGKMAARSTAGVNVANPSTTSSAPASRSWRAVYVFGTPTARIPAPLAETIPARLSSITRQFAAARSHARLLIHIVRAGAASAGAGLQGNQCQPIAFRVGLALVGVLGRDDRCHPVEAAQSP